MAPPGAVPFDNQSKAKAQKVNRALDKHKQEHLNREIAQSAQQGDWEQVEVYIAQAADEGFLTDEDVKQLSAIVNNEKFLKLASQKITADAPVQIKTDKNGNVFSGKGKSYANRVEGPDGWGQHVPVTRDDDEYDIPF